MTEKPPREPRGGSTGNGGAWWRETEKPPRFTIKLPKLPKLPKRAKKIKPPPPPPTGGRFPKPEAPPIEAVAPTPPKPKRRPKKIAGKRLIVTADDFGASPAVNEAVERAHRGGILTAASLMVAGEAFADAVARAKAMPDLGVGLHIVLVEGRPVLPPEELPDLVDEDGFFRTDMGWVGAEIFFRPSVRAQVYHEIEAQFEAFAATGLPLDHVNAHKHFHLHPTIAALILEIGEDFGMQAARAPVEPLTTLNAIEPTPPTFLSRITESYARSVAKRFRDRGVMVPDQVFGLAWSGALTRDRLAALIEHLPEGTSEIYTHPATAEYPGSAPGYRYSEELAALTDPAIRNQTVAKSIALGSFAVFAED